MMSLCLHPRDPSSSRACMCCRANLMKEPHARDAAAAADRELKNSPRHKTEREKGKSRGNHKGNTHPERERDCLELWTPVASLLVSLSSSSISLSLSVLRHSECVSRGTFLSVQPARVRASLSLDVGYICRHCHRSLISLSPADARRWRTASSRVLSLSLLHLSAPYLSPPTLARLSRWETQQRREQQQQQLSHEDVRQRDLRCT